MIFTVVITPRATRELKAVPEHVVRKLLAWVLAVEQFGLEEVRRVPGYHDEPLKGKRKGQRSIRLSKAYRAIYEIKSGRKGEAAIEFASIEEVSKHGY